jgi:pilus assembly protein CpaB
MKWGVVILLIFGVVAAACAALLVSVMGTGSRAAGKGTQGIEVVVAKKSLPAMTVVTTDDFVKQMVSRNDLPQGQGQIANPTRVVGRVLSMPVIEGQVLTESCFVADGTGAQLAAALPEGMRAFTLSLSTRSAPDRLLLYPGCVVDVLFGARLSGRGAPGQALSTTMLQGIQVLAVQGDSVVSNPEAEGGKGAQARRANGGALQVTLLVDQKQAEALQLITDNGNVTLIIRNPLDKTVSNMQATVLSQGRLATFGSALTPEILAAAQKARQNESFASQLPALTGPNDANQPSRALLNSISPSAAAQPDADQTYQAAQRPHLSVTVIRGKETKSEEFQLSGSEAGAEK